MKGEVFLNLGIGGIRNCGNYVQATYTETERCRGRVEELDSNILSSLCFSSSGSFLHTS